MKKLIKSHLNGKKILLLFLITNFVYGFMLLVTIPKVMSFSDGIKLLDMMPIGYNAEYVNTLFNTLGEKGRFLYLYRQIPIDMVYPFLFGVSYFLILAYFLNKLNKLKSLFYYLCFLPVIAGIFDYFENIGIIFMLSNYPSYSQNLIMSTNLFTIIKSITTSIYFIVLIVVLVLVGLKTIKQKQELNHSK